MATLPPRAMCDFFVRSKRKHDIHEELESLPKRSKVLAPPPTAAASEAAHEEDHEEDMLDRQPSAEEEAPPAADAARGSSEEEDEGADVHAHGRFRFMLPEGLPSVLLRPPAAGQLRPEVLPNPYALVPYTPPQQVLRQVLQQALHAAHDPGDWQGQQQQVRQLLRQLRRNRPDLHFDNELRLPESPAQTRLGTLVEEIDNEDNEASDMMTD